ncbi:hypothetical protein Tco_1549007 [Tanacetum coccineum]
MEKARKQQVPKETIISSDITALKELDQKTTLFETMTKSKSFNKIPKHRALYHALIESILKDEEAMDEGLKRQRTSKGTETSKNTFVTKNSSKGKTLTTSSKSSKFGKSAKDQVEEPIFMQGSDYAKHDDADMPRDQGENLGKTDEQPNDEAVPKNDWYKKYSSDTSPYPERNEGKLVDDGLEQSWLNDMAKAIKPPLTFDELMPTPIDFSAFVMNRLKIDNLTKEILVGPAYNLLKETCKSYVELDYTMEECYHAFQIVPADFFFNNELEYFRGGSNDTKYTASMTKSKATRYELKGIEDMVPNLWSPVKVVYDRYALLGISHWRTKRQNFYGYTTKMASNHNVYSTKRILSIISVKVNEWYGYGHIEEIVVKRANRQLYTFKEGNFKRLHLNVIKDMLLLIVQNKLNNLNGNVVIHLAASLHMSRRPAYTTLSNPQGVIYEDKLKQKRFMRADELYKFSDGTLISVHDTLSQMLHELHLGYNKAMRRRLWTRLDQQRTRIMIKSINQKLLDRRILRSLEKFIGGREYGEDLRLLQRTI